MSAVDILVVDNNIRENFLTQYKNIDYYQKLLEDIDHSLEVSNLNPKKIKELKVNRDSLCKRIYDIQNEV